MKKLLLVLASLAMIIGLCACGGGGGLFAKPTPTPIPEIDPATLITIDDVALNGSGKTLASTSSLQIKEKMTKTEKSAKVGELIAGEAKKIGIEAVVFDRNGFLYHGRIKELAEAARKGGLKF